MVIELVEKVVEIFQPVVRSGCDPKGITISKITREKTWIHDEGETDIGHGAGT